MFFIRFSPDGGSNKEVPSTSFFKELGKLDNTFDPYPWKIDHWQNLSESQDEALFLLGREKVMGWAIFKLVPSDSLAHLLKILILPEFRRKGLGEGLLKKALLELEKCNYLKFYLEVETGNPAILIYQRLGFSKVHEIPNFYGQGRNAIAMTR